MVVTILWLLFNAALLGGIIAVMEQGEFPGLLPMIGCVLVATVPAILINRMLPPAMFIVGLAVGATCAGFAISALCGMSVKRAIIAASIYLVAQILVSFVLLLALT